MFFTKTVDSVVANLKKNVEDLRKLESELETKQWDVEEEVQVLRGKAIIIAEEREKATRVANKLEALLA